MPSFSLSVAMRSAACMRRRSPCPPRSFDGQRLGGFGVELARQVALGGFELGQQLRRDGEQVAAGQLGDLADVAEAGAHDHCVL
jgi:hypothetical protein